MQNAEYGMRTQAKVARLIEERGYRDGWAAGEFAARQIAKLTEELGELARALVVPEASMNDCDWLLDLAMAAQGARAAFDTPELWPGAFLDFAHAKSELADVQVVAFVLADALGYDVNRAALEKASGDVERGVRGGFDAGRTGEAVALLFGP